MNKRINHVVVAGAATLSCLILLEVAAGYIFKNSPVTNGKKLVQTAISTRDRYVRVKDGAIEPHPYLLYVNRPGYTDDDGVVQINSLGYRGREITKEKPPGTYRILALGASTTISWPYIKDSNKTWTSLVEAALSQRFPDRKFEVINAGLANATSAELLAGYIFRHRYLEADMVIIHEGVNDVTPLLFENYNPEYTHFRSSGVSVYVGRVERLLLRSNVFRILYAYYWRKVPSVYIPQPSNFERDKALKRVEETYPLGFERNLDLLVRTIKNDGAKVLLVGFVLAREENLSKNSGELAGLEKPLAVGVERNNRIMEGIAATYDVPFLRSPSVEFKDEWFLDFCHLNEDGERAKADWILEGVTKLIEDQ